MSNPLSKPTSRLLRISKLTAILSKYGFEDLRAKLSFKKTANSELFNPTQDFYERIRKAIEEAGPTFVKFGQTLSTREDLLPSGLIIELKKLQDDVAPESINITEVLSSELGIAPNEHFKNIDQSPIASASMAQVYRATLINDDQVILKIKRKNIEKNVQADLILLKDLISILTEYYSIVREINLIYVFEAFAKCLLEELSFTNELNNIEHFFRNFREENSICLLKGYKQFSNNNIICMSFIDGVKINDKQGLLQYNLNINDTLDKVLNLFLEQILKYGFFHADPHPGNILVTEDGKIAFIDMGAMSKILIKDREYLEDFIIYFINKDTDRLIATIKKMAIQIDISNEKILERAIEELLHIIENQNLEDIDIKSIFTKFSHILNQNSIILPDHVYLLVKGIVLLEGIGRELNPQINVVEKIKPYIKKIKNKHITIDEVKRMGLSALWELRRLFKAGPSTFIKIAERLSIGEFQINAESKSFNQYRLEQLRNNSLNRLLIVSSVTFLGACLLAQVDQFKYWGISIISWILFLISACALIILLIKKYKLPK